MEWILFGILLILFGFLFFYLGIREIKKHSGTFNILDFLGSLLMGDFVSGIGAIVVSILFIIVGIVLLVNGGPAN